MVEIKNYITESKARVKANKNASVQEMRGLLAQARDLLDGQRVYRTKANINGIAVELVTNVYHQYDFWLENWWPAADGLLPHAQVFSVNGIPGLEPMAHYCPELHASFFLNTEYYGQCKSWSLGMAAAILERRFHTHSIHGALATYGGKGAVIVAPTGTGKTSQAFKIFLHREGKIVGDDWVFIHFPEEAPSGDRPSLIGTQPERDLYMRTETERDHPWLRSVFDRCKLENIIEDKGLCEFPVGEDGCGLTGGRCVFNEGKTHCYYAFGNSRAMVPREALLGSEKVADSAEIRLVVLLRRDDRSPAELDLNADEAIEVLRKGEYQIRPGAGPKEMWGKMGYEPWFNPYLLEMDNERQEYFFRLIFDEWDVPCMLLNTGVEGVEQTHQRILSALREA